jgi:glycosyltransferase involved in cell wall biosynthesis
MNHHDVCLRNIVFIHPFLLPYHHPRIQALTLACEQAEISFHNITLAGSNEVYKWFFTDGKTRSDHLTLFPNQKLEEIPGDQMWSALKSKLDELRPDVLFIYGYSLQIMRQAKTWADRHGVAVALISDSNGFDKKRFGVAEFLKRLYVSRLDAAFVGGTSSGLYLQKLGMPDDRQLSGYDVIDNEFFCERAKFNRVMAAQVRQKWVLPENYFLFVGRLIEEKNLPRLFKAYAAYAANQAQPWGLVLCGDGPVRSALQTLIDGMPENIANNILFYGHINQPEIIDFYSCASCLVLPSLSETWGLVVNEAMACSLPVIVSNHCGCAADLAIDQFNGWRFDPEDIHALSHLMTKVATLKPAARTELGLHSEEIISHWGLDTFANNAIECARIALKHKSQTHVNINRSN